MTIRDEVIATLRARRARAGEPAFEDVAGFSVPRRYLPVRLWDRLGQYSGPLNEHWHLDDLS